jgi:hypothetical protein
MAQEKQVTPVAAIKMTAVAEVAPPTWQTTKPV